MGQYMALLPDGADGYIKLNDIDWIKIILEDWILHAWKTWEGAKIQKCRQIHKCCIQEFENFANELRNPWETFLVNLETISQKFSGNQKAKFLIKRKTCIPFSEKGFITGVFPEILRNFFSNFSDELFIWPIKIFSQLFSFLHFVILNGNRGTY